MLFSLLNLHAPMKSKKQCANHKSYMTKTLCKVIMKQSELASKYHKTKNTKDCNSYKKQRNFCSKLYKKGSKVDSAFHPPEVDRMSTRNFWELSGKK